MEKQPDAKKPRIFARDRKPAPSPHNFLEETLTSERNLQQEAGVSFDESRQEIEPLDQTEIQSELKQLTGQYERTKKILNLTTEPYARANLMHELLTLREAAHALSDKPEDLAEFGPTKAERKEARVALERLRMEMLGHLLQLTGSMKGGPEVIEDYVRRAEEIHREAGLGEEDYHLLKPFHDARAEQKKETLPSAGAILEHSFAKEIPMAPEDLLGSAVVQERQIEQPKKERMESSALSRWAGKFFLGREPEVTERVAREKKEEQRSLRENLPAVKEKKQYEASSALSRWAGKFFLGREPEVTERAAQERKAEREMEREAKHMESSTLSRWASKFFLGREPEVTERVAREEKKEREQSAAQTKAPQKQGSALGRFFRKTALAGLLGFASLPSSNQNPNEALEKMNLPKQEVATTYVMPAQEKQKETKSSVTYVPKRNTSSVEKLAPTPRIAEESPKQQAAPVKLFDSLEKGYTVRTPDKNQDALMFSKFQESMQGVHYFEANTYSKALQTIIQEYHLNDIAPEWFMKLELEVPRGTNEKNWDNPQEFFETVDFPGGGSTVGLQNYMQLSTTMLNWMAKSQENFNWGVASLTHEYIHAWQKASAGIESHNVREAQAHFFTSHPNAFAKFRNENYAPLGKDGKPSATEKYSDVSATFPEVDNTHKLIEALEFESYYKQCTEAERESPMMKKMHLVSLQETQTLFDNVDDSHKFWYASVFEQDYNTASVERKGELQAVHEKVMGYVGELAGITDPNEFGAVSQYFSLYPETFPDWLQQNAQGKTAPSITLTKRNFSETQRQQISANFEKYYASATPEAKNKLNSMREKLVQAQNTLDARDMIVSR